MKFEFDMLHSAGITHQAADALTRLPTAHWCTEPIDEDIRTQWLAYYDNDPCLVDPIADTYFELEEDDLYEILRIIPDDVHLLSVAMFVKVQESTSICSQFTGTFAVLTTQFDFDENCIVV